ncbi:MAG: hypothetical protein U0835_08470 [Isosphaeraceae bacterium]
MTGPDPEKSVERVIAEYLAAEDAGATPDRAAILAAHPDLADEPGRSSANRTASTGWRHRSVTTPHRPLTLPP